MISASHQRHNQADTDKDLNERAEFTADEEAVRNDPTFGIGEIQASNYDSANHRPGQSQHQVPVTTREDHGDEDDDFWYGSGNGQ